MGRPPMDRHRVTVWLPDPTIERVHELADEEGVTPSDVYRSLLRLGLAQWDEGER